MASFRTEGRKAYERLKPGKYFWKVEEAESAYKNGVEQIKLILRVGDKTGEAKVYDTLTFSDKAFFRVELFLKSAGVYPGDGVDVDVYPSALVGLSGWCETFDKKADNGRTYTNIDTWLEASKQDPQYLFRLAERQADPFVSTVPADETPF